ncbi:MAG: Secretion system C-terminal sorting domain [Bacteroidota bacterium]|jgi:hypothetical protein
MKNIWLYCLLIDPFCLATQGGSKTIHTEAVSLIADWSIGQSMVIQTINKGYPIDLSAGFIQSKNCDRCLFKTLDSFLLPLKLGPNPVEDFLQIKMNQSGVIWEALEIYDIKGILLYRAKPLLSGIAIHYTIPFNTYLKGLYFLKVYFLVDGIYPVSRTFQIYKT